MLTVVVYVGLIKFSGEGWGELLLVCKLDIYFLVRAGGVLLLVCKLDRYFLATSITQVQTQTTRVSLIIQRYL